MIPKYIKTLLKTDSTSCKKNNITDNCSNCGYQRECDNFDQREADYYDNK